MTTIGIGGSVSAGVPTGKESCHPLMGVRHKVSHGLFGNSDGVSDVRDIVFDVLVTE